MGERSGIFGRHPFFACDLVFECVLLLHVCFFNIQSNPMERQCKQAVVDLLPDNHLQQTACYSFYVRSCNSKELPSYQLPCVLEWSSTTDSETSTMCNKKLLLRSVTPLLLPCPCCSMSSCIRQQLLPNCQPEYAGYLAWRGVAHADRLSPGVQHHLADKATMYKVGLAMACVLKCCVQKATRVLLCRFCFLTLLSVSASVSQETSHVG